MIFISKEEIREIFLATGFTIKEGETDLKEYVYSAAKILAATVAAKRRGFKIETDPEGHITRLTMTADRSNGEEILWEFRSKVTLDFSGLPKEQEPKYTILGNHLLNRASDEKIPHDEPVFILRARDRNAATAIHYYAELCQNEEHHAAVLKRVSDFRAFATAHPDRMKWPDTDTGFSLGEDTINSRPTDGS